LPLPQGKTQYLYRKAGSKWQMGRDIKGQHLNDERRANVRAEHDCRRWN
jgi:hypothetical protein